MSICQNGVKGRSKNLKFFSTNINTDWNTDNFRYNMVESKYL